MNAATLINQNSGLVDYYTPVEIIEAARKTMGSIDLDPASCFEANKIVKATHYFTKNQNGLSRSWEASTVWLNHPFGRGLNGLWINNLLSQYGQGYFNQACCITYACTSEKWFRSLLLFPQCFLHGRTNYRLPDGSILKGNTKGSVVTYLGPRERTFNFATEFQSLGTIKVHYDTRTN